MTLSQRVPETGSLVQLTFNWCQLMVRTLRPTRLTDYCVAGEEEEGGLFYENVGFESQKQQQQEPDIQPHIVQQEVYDFPR